MVTLIVCCFVQAKCWIPAASVVGVDLTNVGSAVAQERMRAESAVEMAPLVLAVTVSWAPGKNTIRVESAVETEDLASAVTEDHGLLFVWTTATFVVVITTARDPRKTTLMAVGNVEMAPVDVMVCQAQERSLMAVESVEEMALVVLVAMASHTLERHVISYHHQYTAFPYKAVAVIRQMRNLWRRWKQLHWL